MTWLQPILMSQIWILVWETTYNSLIYVQYLNQMTECDETNNTRPQVKALYRKCMNWEWIICNAINNLYMREYITHRVCGIQLNSLMDRWDYITMNIIQYHITPGCPWPMTQYPIATITTMVLCRSSYTASTEKLHSNRVAVQLFPHALLILEIHNHVVVINTNFCTRLLQYLNDLYSEALLCKPWASSVDVSAYGQSG